MRSDISTALPTGPAVFSFPPVLKRSKRIGSIDFLRGIVMIIMAIDHVRDYFHADAFVYSPTDLSKTNVALFFTRWITHFCAPVFVFLAGTSAYLYGAKRSPKDLSYFLFTRGVWLVVVELFILGFFRTFNLSFSYFNLQVIWAIGICMMVLSVLTRLPWAVILGIGIVLVFGHNLLDSIHLQGTATRSIIWSMLHDVNHYTIGRFLVYVHYPVLPWIGIMALGYCLGHMYTAEVDAGRRRKVLTILGIGAIALFILLRLINVYGDASHWTVQKSAVFTLLSFINVTKYPPSLLYTLMTLGPALLILSISEKPLLRWQEKITVFGRVPMFYYLAHILLIHLYALAGAVISGFRAGDMVLSASVNDAPQLKGYGFGLPVVYLVTISLVLLLYPLCRSYDRFKRRHQATWPWLSYL